MSWLGRPQCDTTWEPSSALPTKLVADYEAGITMEAITEPNGTAFGHLSTALVVRNIPLEPERKKKKTDCSLTGQQLVVYVCKYTNVHK